MDAGEIGRGRTRVIAGAVAERLAVAMRQPGEHQRVLPERLERLQDARELEAAALRPSASSRPW